MSNPLALRRLRPQILHAPCSVEQRRPMPLPARDDAEPIGADAPRDDSSSPTSIGFRAQDRDQIRMRRQRVWAWRLEGLSLSAIRVRLSRLNPPIIVHASQISRDLAHMSREARSSFDRTQFDPVAFVVEQVHRFEALYAKTIRDAHRTRSVLERVACYRTASHLLEQIAALMQDVGVVDSRIGLMLAAMRDGEKVERLPSAEDLQRMFESIVITEGDLTSEAEKAYGWGDAAAFEAANGRNRDGE
jgi:hypothetical protein